MFSTYVSRVISKQLLSVVKASRNGEVAIVAFRSVDILSQVTAIWGVIIQQKDKIGSHQCWPLIRHANQVVLLVVATKTVEVAASFYLDIKAGSIWKKYAAMQLFYD